MNSFQDEIQEKLKDIERLPSFPSVVQKVLKLLKDPEVEFKNLTREIIRDPGLTADIIRLSNSAYYHPPREIRSIEEALKILGLNTLKEIIFVAAARGILKQPVEGYKLESKDMWQHSLAVGYLAMHICTKLGLKQVPRDVAFTAGLMHDCGKIVLASTFRKAFLYIQQEHLNNPRLTFIEIEKKILGYTHAEIGAILLKLWNFPEEFIDSVHNLYHPEHAKINSYLTSVLHIANWLALSAGIGIDTSGMHNNLSHFALQKLNLDDTSLQHFYENIPEVLAEIKDLMEL